MDGRDYNTKQPERKRGQHLQREGRGAIQHLKRLGNSNRAIAREIGCASTTVSVNKKERSNREWFLKFDRSLRSHIYLDSGAYKKSAPCILLYYFLNFQVYPACLIPCKRSFRVNSNTKGSKNHRDDILKIELHFDGFFRGKKLQISLMSCGFHRRTSFSGCNYVLRPKRQYNFIFRRLGYSNFQQGYSKSHRGIQIAESAVEWALFGASALQPSAPEDGVDMKI